MDLRKFIPLTKMEEQADGSLHVFGTVTAELPDAENEVCDYEGTKPYYKAKVAQMTKTTGSVEGMDISIMPLREMHTLKAIGAGRTIEFDDVAKTIRMGFEVVESEAIKKFRKGVLVGFSQGGRYVGDLKADPQFHNCKRYVCDPGEVSGVDSPCLPSALVESMKGKTVTLQKANGVTEEVQLEIKAFDTPSLTKIEQQQTLILELLGELKKAHATITIETPNVEIEAQADPVLAPQGDGIMSKITDQASLTKAAKTLHDHLEGLKEKHDAAGEHMKKAHEGIAAKHEAVGEHIEKCMKACKDSMDGEEPEKAATVELVKSGAWMSPADVSKALEPILAELATMKKANADLTELMKKTPAPVAVHTGNVDVSKTTSSTGFEDLITTTVTH